MSGGDQFDWMDGWESAATRHDDPPTSKAAAARVNQIPRKMKVLATLIVAGPLTSFMVAESIAQPVQNISPCFKPMERDGWIIVVGKVADVEGGHERQLYGASSLGCKMLDAFLARLDMSLARELLQ